MQNFNASYNSATPCNTGVCAGNDIPTYTPISPQYSHVHTYENGSGGLNGKNEGAAHVYHTNQQYSSTSAAPYAPTTQQIFPYHLNTPPATQTVQNEPFAGGKVGVTALAGTGQNNTQASLSPASAFLQQIQAQTPCPPTNPASVQPYNLAQIMHPYTAQMPYAQGLNAEQQAQSVLNNIFQTASEKATQNAREKTLQNAILNLPLIAALATQAPPFFSAQQSNAFLPTASQSNPLMTQGLSPASPFFQNIVQPQTLLQSGFSEKQKNDETELNHLQTAERAQVTADENGAKNQPDVAITSDSETYWRTLTPTNAEYLQSTPARKTLKSYLQERCSYLDASEIEEILTLAKELETQAVEVFKAQGTHKTKLQEQNRQAIDKLNTQTAYARGSSPAQGATFTREQIGKMSMKEFMENQAQILAQYAKGTIQ